MKVRELITYIGLIASLNTYSQDFTYNLENISLENGLSSQSVFSIHQDQRGFLWFGTYNGLNRYDGTNVKVYYFDSDSSENKIDYNYINCIIEDSHGFLWMGTTGGGIIVFNSKTNKHKRFSNQFINNPIFSLCIDKKNNIWAGTRNGLYSISKNKKVTGISDLSNIELTFKHYKHLANQKDEDAKNQISFIISSYDNKLWLAGDKGGGLTSFNPETGTFINYHKIAIPNETGEHIIYGAKGLSSNNVSSLFEEKNGNIWCGTLDKGLCLFDRKSKTFTLYDFQKYYGNKNSNHILSIFRDKHEVLWIGTNRRGLFGCPGNGKNIFDNIFHIGFNIGIKNTLPDNVIRKIYQGNSGELWLATRRKGIVKLEHSDYNINLIKIREKLERDHKTEAVLKSTDGYIWFGTWANGVQLLVPDSVKGFKHHRIGDAVDQKKQIHTLFQDNKGKIWVGGHSEGGLFQLKYPENEPEKAIIVPFPKETVSLELSAIKYVRIIFEDSKNQLWIGSDKGLFRLTYMDEEIICRAFKRNNENPEKSIIANLIFDICEDDAGNIWAATFNGLTCLKIDEETDSAEFIHYLHKYKDGQHYDRDIIQSIAVYKDSLIWAGTRSGIRCINIKTNEINSYYTSDGLPDNFIAFTTLDKNYNLWVGTLRSGLALFNTKSRKGKIIHLSDDIYANRISLNSYFHDNEDLYFGTGNGIIKISPDKYLQNKALPQPVITKLLLANKTISVDEKKYGKVILEKDISYSDYIELNHKEKSIGFEFSSLNFSNQKNTQYKYKLDGFDERWNITNHDWNFAMYTNLSPGSYKFILHSSNEEGFWNDEPAILAIKINLPFWKEWWAYLIYITLISTIVIIIQREIARRIRLVEQIKYERKEKDRISELNQLKSRFFTNISHEVRTPLSLIIDPLAQLLQNKNIDQRSKSTLRLIFQNSKRLLGLINELIDFRKVETGQVKLNIKEDDIVAFIKRIKDYFQYLAKSNNIDYTFYSTDEKITGFFDSAIVEKILNNLLSNAFKFTPENGKITIHVSRYQKQQKNKKWKKQPDTEETEIVKITVEDTGIGISKENMENIFKRFYQIESKNMDAMMGSGIGLSLTKDLLDIHGGKIKVKSKEGVGTKFTIKLPITKSGLEPYYNFDTENAITLNENIADQKNHDYLYEQEKDTIEEGNKESKPLILIVDDYNDIRSYIKNSLESDYNIIEAANGQEGFDIVKEQKPDLIISDLMMPVLDGLKFCKMVKTNFETSHIPFILLTAKSSEQSTIDGLQTGADDYIPKPFNVQALKLIIKNRLRTRRQYHEKFIKEVNLSPKDITSTKIDSDFLEKAIQVIKDNMGNPNFGINELMYEMAVSRSGLHDKLKQLTALSATSFIRTVKLKEAAILLKSSTMNISEVAYKVGFTNPKYFSKRFKEFFGQFPSDYKKNN